MGRISKAKEKRLENMAKARARNSNNNLDSTMNDSLIESQLEISNSASDNTPENLPLDNESFEFESDVTPDNLSTSDETKDPDYVSFTSKLMVIPDTFLALIMQFVVCAACQKQGQIVPNVTNADGFQNDITFICRCKHSFSLPTFPNTNINEVLIRNMITNGIPRQSFQRFLQIGNFGANVEGKECGINLASRQSMEIFKQQNQVIIDGADQIHKVEVDRIVQANQYVTISTDMCYAKRGYHSPVGHAALICNKTVIDSKTVKRASKKSETAYGDIQDTTASKLEAYAITKMFKHIIPVIGPLIEQIDLDQDARLQSVIENMKWEPEDLDEVNKWTGKKEVTIDMIGKSVWSGKVPRIHNDKVRRVNFLIAKIENFRLRWAKCLIWVQKMGSQSLGVPNSN